MNNIKGIVFDLYGTLYDVHSVIRACEKFYPGQGVDMSNLWRQKQLEYTWLRSLMNRYVSFEKATEDALRFTCNQLGLPLDDETHQRLADAYLEINPYEDTPVALRKLKDEGIPLGIISNGSHRSIEEVVTNSEMNWAFEELISVEDVQVFKPHESVYSLAEKKMGCSREDILFISSNAWDASAASYFGFPVCWINRKNGAFDELDARPKHMVNDLNEMADWLLEQRN